ncbi:hypothetical protein Rsub_12505 [Raphidocelis subcapitata]|uniref:DNA-(apurinic or apyrimidinic site) endonuclease n=1 Tax=Raphidocelis subcapitata TaxID=307507 RepID=A0A2V0PRG3_9CHLO|nr:hypothetical protein Rsub_12505 [Raphidocelis subcapitata]|eukprot:GBF99865.1 hypothetical protein Rsub_12505 [Raphidocelis subcapitata]
MKHKASDAGGDGAAGAAAAAAAAAAGEASPAAATPRKRARRSPAADKPAGGDADAVAPKSASPPAAAAAAAKKKASPSPGPVRRSARSPAPKKAPAPAAAAAPAAKAPAAAAGRELYTTAMRAPRLESPALTVMAWNVAGLRSLIKKDAGAVRRLVEEERVDVLCLQETKLQDSHVAAATKGRGRGGGGAVFNCSAAKKGYSGVATFTRSKPLSSSCGIGLPDHDDEGRVVTVELPSCFVVNAYVPNSGEGLKRLAYRTGQWDVAFSDYVKGLEARGKPVIVAGDLNCAHHPIDIHNPKGNLRSAGFTQEERDSFGEKLVAPGGPLVDTFRAQHPNVVGYTYYSYRTNGRAKNAGWRLDYLLVSQSLAPRVHDAFILRDVLGSDHVPLGVVIKKD